jgi:hypothetical protein
MKIWLAVSFSPRGCNDQPQIWGVYSDKTKAVKAAGKMETETDITWKQEGKGVNSQLLYFYKGEDGDDDFPVGSVFSMTVNAKPSYDVCL